MNWFNRLRARFTVDRDLSEEIAQHLDERVDELVSGGLSRHDATRQARREFGNATLVAERGRDVWRFAVVEDLWADLRYASRQLRRSPAFAAASIATLALGIGANTAVFSVSDALLFRKLPVQSPDQLVVFDWLRTQDSMVAGYSGYGRPGPAPGVGIRTSFSVLTFERFHAAAATLSHVFAFSETELTIIADKQADTASGLLVTGDYFSGLGVPALIGRTISSSDDSPDAEPVAVVSHRYWQRRFSGDPNVVGKTIEVNRSDVVIVGVTPEGFHGVRMTDPRDVTLPGAMASRLSQTGQARPVSVWWLQMMGRLKPGFTRDQALAELQRPFADTVRESWAARSSDTPNPTRTGVPQLRVLSGAQGPHGPRLDARPMMMFVFAVTIAILLIGCVNLANLLLVRASARLQEVSVRLTLGAGRWRVIRQLLTESMLLAFAGGMAGVILAWWGRDFMLWIPSGETPIVEARINPRVLAFTAGLSAITAFAFGMWPAFRATRTDLGLSLKAGAQKGSIAHGILSKTLLAAQVAISLVLLAGAGLFVRTLYNFSLVDVGFNADNLLVFRISPAVQGQAAARVFDTYERLMSGIEAVPGVESATLSIMPVIARSEWEESVRPDGAGDPQDVFIQIVRWNFLGTMGMPLLAGRGLSAADTEGRPRVAIVNETMARQMFGEPYPVGRHFQFVNGRDRNVPIQVVGVVRDAKYASLAQRAPPTLFMPYTQLPPSGMTVEVRTASDPTALAPAVRDAVQRTDPSLPLIDMKTERQQIAETIGVPRAIALLTAVSGVVALLLACLGLYGIVSYDATRRTNEIGLRMALGARRSHVFRLVVRRTLIVVTIGAATGLGLALVASRFIAGLLFGVRPTDPLTMASVVALLMSVAFLAAYLPARRASRIDPAHALRHE